MRARGRWYEMPFRKWGEMGLASLMKREPAFCMYLLFVKYRYGHSDSPIDQLVRAQRTKLEDLQLVRALRKVSREGNE